MTESELQAEIVKLVSDHWRRYGAPMLLAQLGSMHDNQISMASRTYGFPLRRYIEAKLGDDVRIIRHSRNMPLIGVVPRIEEANSISDPDEALEKMLSVERRETRPRYERDFWFAFQNQLAPAHRRFVIRGYPPRIIDLPETEKPPVDADEIGRQYILSIDQSVDREAVHAAINAWIDSVGAARENYVFQGQGSFGVGRASVHSKNLLIALFAALSDEQLRRINMPLDIASRLYRERLR